MDLHTVTTYRRPTTRAELALAPGERILGGGTWLYSEPQVQTTGLVDLTSMGWAPLQPLPDGGLRIAATCTIAELLALPANPAWTAQPLFRQAAECLLASFKVWTAATVGGNIAQSFAAGAMISMAATLDGVAEVWRPDGTDARIPVAEIPAGNGENSLAHGEVIRAIDLPGEALRSRTALRKIQEMLITFLMESSLTKEQIFEIYLNIIEWGPGLYGIKDAAQHYFGKSPGQLSPREAAYLALIIPGPMLYHSHYEQGVVPYKFQQKVEVLVDKLVKLGTLKPEQVPPAESDPIRFRRGKGAPVPAPGAPGAPGKAPAGTPPPGTPAPGTP